MRVQVYGRVREDSTMASPERTAETPSVVRKHFPSMTQTFCQNESTETVFNSTATALVDDFLDGRNTSFLVVGNGKSGKKFTMLGTKAVRHAMVQLAFAEVFVKVQKLTQTSPNCTCALQLRCLQVYHGQVIDLLQTEPPTQLLAVHYSASAGYHVPGMIAAPVASAREATSSLQLALNNVIHLEDSAIFVMLDMKRVDHSRPGEQRLNSTFTFTLLPSTDVLCADAVSLRLGTGPQGCLELYNVACLVGDLALHPAPDRFIDYNKSVLTKLLSETLGGNCRTQCMVTMARSSLEQESFQPIVHLANQLSRVENYSLVNTSDTQDLLRLQRATINHYRRRVLAALDDVDEPDEGLHEENVQLQRDKLALMAEMRALRDQLTVVKLAKAPDLEQLDDHVKALETALEMKMSNLELRDQLARSEAKRRETTIWHRDREKELDTLKEEHDDLILKHGKAVTGLDQATEQVRILEDQMLGQITKCEELQLEVMQLLNEKKFHEERATEFHNALDRIQKEAHEMHGATARTVGANVDHVQMIANLTTRLKNVAEVSWRERHHMTKKIAESEAARNELEKKLLKQSHSQYSELFIVVRDQERDIRELHVENQDLKKQLLEKTDELAVVRDEVDYLGSVCVGAQQFQGKVNQDYTDLSRKYSSLGDEFVARLHLYMNRLKGDTDCDERKDLVDHTVADIRAVDRCDRERLHRDNDMHRTQHTAMLNTYHALLHCYSEARTQLEAAKCKRLGPHPSKFTLSASKDSKAVATSILHDKLLEADDTIKKLQKDAEKQTVYARSLQERLGETVAEVVRAQHSDERKVGRATRIERAYSSSKYPTRSTAGKTQLERENDELRRDRVRLECEVIRWRTEVTALETTLTAYTGEVRRAMVECYTKLDQMGWCLISVLSMYLATLARPDYMDSPAEEIVQHFLGNRSTNPGSMPFLRMSAENAKRLVSYVAGPRRALAAASTVAVSGRQP